MSRTQQPVALMSPSEPPGPRPTRGGVAGSNPDPQQLVVAWRGVARSPATRGGVAGCRPVPVPAWLVAAGGRPVPDPAWLVVAEGRPVRGLVVVPGVCVCGGGATITTIQPL